MIELWHNPRCSKSRQALALLEEAGADVQVVRYLETPPNEARLREVAALLGLSPRAMMRVKEEAYKDQGLADADDDALFAAMAATPKLIERPVAISRNRAVIGRPPETVLGVV